MDIDRNLRFFDGYVSGAERGAWYRQLLRTLWLTGLSGSGKSTLAFALECRLIDAGYSAFVLDGDNIRHGLNRNLGFSPADRTENIRRIAEVARLMNEAGLIVITACISPYIADRKMALKIIGVSISERFISARLYRCVSKGMSKAYIGVRIEGKFGSSPALMCRTSRLSLPI